MQIVIFSGEKPFRCSLCDKSFNQKNNLTTHLRTHSDYHPSSCSTCKQNFSSFNELFNHMRQHVEEKPHICTVCNKVLNCQSDLAEHMKSHSNKPYKCDVSWWIILELALNNIQFHPLDLSEAVHTIQQFKDSYQDTHLSGSVQMQHVHEIFSGSGGI
jgi:hypothetical protein